MTTSNDHTAQMESQLRADADYIALKRRQPKHSSCQSSLSNLFDTYKRGAIILSPSYQRGDVWVPARQELLVEDVLLRGKYMPPLVLCVHDNVQRMTDGKQRMTAFIKYLSNELPVKKRYFKDLSPLLRELVLMTQITCTVHHYMSLQEELELFRCLQQGVDLTAGEKLNGRLDPAMLTIKDWLHKFGAAIPKRTIAQKRRMNDLRTLTIAVIMVCDSNGGLVLKTPALNTWLDGLGQAGLPPGCVARCEKALKRILEVRACDPAYYDRKLPQAGIIYLLYFLSTDSSFGSGPQDIMARIKELCADWPVDTRVSNSNFDKLKDNWWRL
jgi:hypothetical protein